MTLAIDEDGVRSAAHMPSLIDAIENVLIEEHDGYVLMPPRTNVISEQRFLRLMPAYLRRSGFLGYKSFHGSMSEGVRYVIVLIREADGEIVALIDAAYLTALRTGATSGVAARHLARANRVKVGIIGSGLEARTNMAAVSAVRSVTSAWYTAQILSDAKHSLAPPATHWASKCGRSTQELLLWLIATS